MDHREHLFLEHLFAAISSKRRVLSGFALGVVASLLLVSLLASINAPTAIASSPTSLFSWFFSTSYSSSSLFAGKNAHFANSTGSHGGASALESANGTSLNKTLERNFSRPLSDQGSQKIHQLSPVNSASSSLDENSAASRNPGNFTSRDGNGTLLAQSGKQNVETSALEKNDEFGVRGDEETKQLNDALSGKNESLQKLTARSSNDSSVSVNAMGGVSQKKCDMFDGRWVKDSTKPYYPPGSCPYIDVDFDCQKNGRPDDEFLRWRWQPYGCDIPSLNATDFLERLRGKRILFVGDSLNRNMWESLVCILHHSIKNKSRVYEVSGRREFKLQGYYSIKFEDYMSSVDFVRSPFLVKELFLETVNGSKDERLRLDLLDETTTAYPQADIVVFNTGHWWTHEKMSSGINYYQEGNYVYPVLGVMKAFKKALTTWASWIDRNINSSKTQVVFRGYSLTHFRGGQWNSGGQCHKEVEPIYNETFLTKYPEKMRALEEVLHEIQTPVLYLNISRLTDYRKDGHPSIYRKKYNSEEEFLRAPKTQDCSHWCLPGVPDTWNELLYAHLLRDGKGSWRL